MDRNRITLAQLKHSHTPIYLGAALNSQRMENSMMKSDTIRRLIALAVGLFVVVLNNKLGLGLTTEDKTAIVALIVGYFAQSVFHSAKKLANGAIGPETPTIEGLP